MKKGLFTFIYAGDIEQRLDYILLEHLAIHNINVSRSQLKKLIESGNVSVAGKLTEKAGFPVKPKTEISFEFPVDRPSQKDPFEFKLEIIYEDSEMLVINKPAGIIMHPGAGNPDKTILNAVINYLGKDACEPFIVHRLDKDTTGLVIIAKNVEIKALLSEQFSERKAGRKYKALVFTTPRAVRAIQKDKQGRIDTYFGRHPNNRKLMTVLPDGKGKRAITNWQVIEPFKYGTLIELKLETGRTHQIRVHMDYIGSPVIGDKTYGNFNDLPKELLLASEQFGRQALHAFELSIFHPRSGEQVSWRAEPPIDFIGLIDKFRES